MRGVYAEEAPTVCRVEDKPRQNCCRQAPQETGKHVIAWQGCTRGEVEGRICKCESTADKVMSYPANGKFMFDRRSLDDVLVYEFAANGVQEPPTDGPVASSTLPTRDPEPLQKVLSDVHQSGTY